MKYKLSKINNFNLKGNVMAKYTCYNELVGNTLAVGDIITLGDVNWKVESRYFCNTERHSDKTVAQMANEAGIDNLNAFLTREYGYPPAGGSFPEFNTGDMEAATRAALGLFLNYEQIKPVKKSKKVRTVGMEEIAEFYQVSLDKLRIKNDDDANTKKVRSISFQQIADEMDIPIEKLRIRLAR
jgi:hypothetical protein